MAKLDDWNNKQIQNDGFSTISEAIEAKIKHFSKKELAILLAHPKFQVKQHHALCPKHAALTSLLQKDNGPRPGSFEAFLADVLEGKLK